MESKICESCGRIIECRKKWKQNWNQIKFCSDKCRKNKNRFDYTNQIIELLKKRKPASICPSEVLEPLQKKDTVLMEHVRRSARRLAHLDLIEITQGGKAVNPSEFKGPIRLRFKKNESL